MGIFNFLKKPAAVGTIRVEFINGADHSIIAVSDMLPAQLPDTFAINTTLDIKDQKWSVLSAEPLEKTQFLKAGKLRLVLSHLTLANPADALFSLPTISDDIGNARGDTLPNDTVFAMHEDDWRQVEFVSARFSSEINQEFADIQQIWNSEKSGPRFKKTHVRKRIPEPLAQSSLYLDDLNRIFTPQKRFEAVGFLRTVGIIPQSFAWSVSRHLVMWGIVDSNAKVVRLCVSGLPEPDQTAAISAGLATLTERYQLRFIDWCHTTAIHSKAQAFENYFADQR